MAVLIRQKSPNGRTRTCNARCYNAKHDTCVCICNHTNHGVGLDKAIDNTIEMSPELAEQGAQARFSILPEID